MDSPSQHSSQGSLESFLRLLIPVTALQFVGDFRDVREMDETLGRASEPAKTSVRNYITYFARHIRAGHADPLTQSLLVQAFNEAVNHNLAPHPEKDWIAMSDLCRRYVPMQRIVDEACAQGLATVTQGNGIPVADFVEVINVLLSGCEQNRKAFELSMMNQVAHRVSEGQRQSGLGKAFAQGAATQALLRTELITPLAPFMPKRVREILGLS
jgi:hypothetical protein